MSQFVGILHNTLKFCANLSKNIPLYGDVCRVVGRAKVYARILAADMNVIITTLAVRKYALLSYDHLIVCWNMSGFLMEHRIDDLERFFSAARYAASYLVPGFDDERGLRD